ncbi:LysR substrate-binding domain-containing protein [Reyranella sp. CPCC 100927]|uniref:LysR substrate-binding domain-containing protein n=1 Tax=Reyranella sp. CPCC 100927 TaxID=2599616 RepID=UPI0011B5CDF8|nr:LysR substrate-binding domain-containing protein [Reyranella sp. CPCC 100927]TWS96862.1 LysR family transcriptional regulator [Reyranella sp. CPCC 100927]
MTMNLRQIEMFRAIMVTGSISGAARLLSVSQPAISRLLAYTEDRLGFSLFERVKGRVQPTPEARQLFVGVDQVHQEVARVNELAEELRNGGTGSVCMVASPSVGHVLVPKAIAQFRARHPDVRIELEILTLADLIGKVSSQRADLAITSLAVDEPTVTSALIGEGRLQVIFPADHPLGDKRVVKAADLAPYPIISYGPHTPYGMIVSRLLNTTTKPIRVNTQVRFTPNACSLVQAGAGIAIVDDFVLMDGAWPNIQSRPLVPKTTTRVHLLTSRVEPLSRIARSFVASLRSLLPAVSAAPAKD